MSDVVRKSMTKRRWSPTPYPAGITHTPVTITSCVCHTASIALEPRKNVAPSFLPVYSLIASFILKPLGLVSVLPMLFEYISSLASMQTMRRLPFALHFSSCFMRSSRNLFLGQVVSFYFVMK